jgi:hypothetical protein
MLAGVAALVLAVDTFLPWFEFRGGRLDAWRAFTVTDVVLALVIVMAFALVALTLTARTTAAPVAVAVWATLVALIGSIWVLVAVLTKPAGAIAHCYGSWLGLAATLTILAATCLSMRDERPARGVDIRAVPDDLPPPLAPPDPGPRDDAA